MNLFKSQLFRLIFLILCLIAITSLSRSVYDLWKRRDIVTQRYQVLLKLDDENKRLKRELSDSQTPEFIEREARDALGMSKPGETVLLLDNATPSAGNIPGSQYKPMENPSWSLWWRLFF
jgi:cell division protein FtsB